MTSPSAENITVPAPKAWISAAWILLLAVALTVWMACLRDGDAQRAWLALLVNFAFFAPMAAGMVVWPAIVVSSRGKWMGPAEKLSRMGLTLAIPSLAALAGLWYGCERWAPWIHTELANQRFWLEPTFLFSRDMAALAILWILAWRYASLRRHGRGTALGAVLIVVYGIVFSLLGFDLVMSLDPKWYSALFGGYFFMSGLYIAVAAWSLLAASHSREVGRDRLWDLGKLLVAFSLLTTYLMYSQLLPQWYGNLRQEMRFLVPRMNELDWSTVSAALVGVVYLGPLVLLLRVRAKRSPLWLGVVAVLVLAGMWVERWWLVYATVDASPRWGLPELSMTAAFLAAAGFGWNQHQRIEASKEIPVP
jgi:hypothetical protein